MVYMLLFGFIILAGLALMFFVTFTELEPAKAQLPLQHVGAALLAVGSIGLAIAY